MTGPPSISATPVVVGSSVKASRSAWTTIWVGPEGFSSPVVVASSTKPVGHPLRIRIEDAGFGVDRYPIGPGSDLGFDQCHLRPGQISVQMGTNPVQGVLDRQPTFPPGIHHISRRRRVRSPRRPIQGRIRQTQTFCDHRLFGVREWPASRSHRPDRDESAPSANLARRSGRSSSLRATRTSWHAVACLRPNRAETHSGRFRAPSARNR